MHPLGYHHHACLNEAQQPNPHAVCISTAVQLFVYSNVLVDGRTDAAIPEHCLAPFSDQCSLLPVSSVRIAAILYTRIIRGSSDQQLWAVAALICWAGKHIETDTTAAIPSQKLLGNKTSVESRSTTMKNQWET